MISESLSTKVIGTTRMINEQKLIFHTFYFDILNVKVTSRSNDKIF